MQRGRKPSHIVTRRELGGRVWFAKKNGFHPNGKLSYTWTPMGSFVGEECRFTLKDAKDIQERQAGYGGKVEVRKIEPDGKAMTV